MPTIVVTDSDKFSIADSEKALRIGSSDSLGWTEFQDDSGDVIIANNDVMTWADTAYAQFAVNPFQEMQSIALSIEPYFEITLGLLAHL